MLYKFVYEMRTKLAYSRLLGHDALPDLVAHKFIRVGHSRNPLGQNSKGAEVKHEVRVRFCSEGRAFCPNGSAISAGFRYVFINFVWI